MVDEEKVCQNKKDTFFLTIINNVKTKEMFGT